MKGVLLNATEEVCGRTKGPPRHKETWWWNEEVDLAIDEKRKCFKKWQKTNLDSDKSAYKNAKQQAKKTVAIAQELKRLELASELNSEEGKRNVFRIAKQMTKERQDVGGVSCLKDSAGRIVTDSSGIKQIWKQYMEKLLNEENVWDKDVSCDRIEGPRCEISREEVQKALHKMKTGKAPGGTGLVAEMLKAAGDLGVEWLTDLCNLVISTGEIPSDWKRSTLVPVYKGKGDPLECGSYRAIKLLEQAMKVVERVLEKRIRDQVKVDEMQFGFTPGRGTTDAIFVVRQMQEQYQAMHKKLFYAFVDLEKAFDRVPREVTEWALRKSGVDEWLVRAVMALYKGARTEVQTADGNSESFEVKVGLHQGSVLSPLLFVVVMEVVSREVRGGLPWELLYADDLVLMARSEEELKRKVQKWKSGMETKGLKVNVAKTKFMADVEGKGAVEQSGKWPCGVCGSGVGTNSIQCTKCSKWIHKKCSGVKGSLSSAIVPFICKTCCSGAHTNPKVDSAGLDIDGGESLERVDKFCYLGDMINSGGGAEAAVTCRMRCAWKKFRELAPILIKKGPSLKLKGKVYESCVRSCMIYGSETWPMKKVIEDKLERTDMRMIRWMCGMSLRDRKTSAELRKRIGVEAINDVMRRNRLRWFGHVERKLDDDWVKRCMNLDVGGLRPRGRPKKTWKETVNNDLETSGIRREDAQDRDKWRLIIHGKTG